MKSGFVSLIGRPNVGKSTLLNSIVGRKIAITSNTAQTTRNIIQGIYTTNDIQIIFVDTPGIHKPKNKLGTILNEQAYYSMTDVDVILFLVDVTQKLGKGDKFILEKLQENINIPVILVLNKIDKINYEELLPLIDEYKGIYPFKEIGPVSAAKRKNIDELILTISNYLKDDIKYYYDNYITNKPITFTISEIVIEKVFYLNDKEVPHSLTCIVENIEKKNNSYYINVAIIVDRDSLKKIIIGKQGNMVKNIGIKARPEIEKILGKKVYLEIYVKVIKKWRDKEKYLQEFGFNDFE